MYPPNLYHPRAHTHILEKKARGNTYSYFRNQVVKSFIQTRDAVVGKAATLKAWAPQSSTYCWVSFYGRITESGRELAEQPRCPGEGRKHHSASTFSSESSLTDFMSCLDEVVWRERTEHESVERYNPGAFLQEAGVILPRFSLCNLLIKLGQFEWQFSSHLCLARLSQAQVSFSGSVRIILGLKVTQSWGCL